MKQVLFFILLLKFPSCFSQEKEQKLRDLFQEYCASVNHGLASPRTFFGAGLGASHIFQPEKVVAFRTGIDLQLFHSWNNSGDPAHYSSVQNIHRTYIDLTIPAVIRLNIKMMFMEFGGNLGFGISGWEKYTQSNFPPNQTAFQTEQKQSWNPGFSAGGTGGIGVLIPMNEKLDLLIRTDVGASAYFRQEYSNVYTRLCVGIHLK